MARFFIITLLLGLCAAAVLWLPAFLRPDAREIRERAVAEKNGDQGERPEYPLLPPDRRTGPGGRIRVGPGDSLWSILKDAFPNASNEELIHAVNITARSNGLRNPSALVVGQDIIIPALLKETIASH